MASPSLPPYEYEEIVELNYEFVNRDGKQEKRRVLFNRWFDIYNDGTLSSRSAEVREGYYQLLVSIYFKNDNPNKQQLVRSFNELMSRDIYEIVV